MLSKEIHYADCFDATTGRVSNEAPHSLVSRMHSGLAAVPIARRQMVVALAKTTKRVSCGGRRKLTDCHGTKQRDPELIPELLERFFHRQGGGEIIAHRQHAGSSGQQSMRAPCALSTGPRTPEGLERCRRR